MNRPKLKAAILGIIDKIEISARLHFTARVPPHKLDRLVFLAVATGSVRALRLFAEKHSAADDYESAEAMVDAWKEWYEAHPLFPSLAEETRQSIVHAMERYKRYMQALKDVRDGSRAAITEQMMSEFIIPDLLRTMQGKPESN